MRRNQRLFPHKMAAFGQVALVGFMHRDLVEQRRWVTEDTYKLSLALARIMPGPLAAQVAIAIGYFENGILGATLVAKVPSPSMWRTSSLGITVRNVPSMRS
jgi:chromate transporter